MDPTIDPELVAKLLTTLNYSLAEIIFEDGKIDLNDMEIVDNMLYVIENGIKRK